MSKIIWDQTGQKLYETGVDRGVLYPQSSSGTYPKGVAWNGLSSVNENPSGGEPNKIYADNNTYLTLYSAEEYGATIEAYTYPDEFAECDGSAEAATGVRIGQQPRKAFGFAYRSLIGNDTEGTKHGYKIHLIYNCMASPSDRNHETVNDDPEASTLSWEVSTTPVQVTGFDPASSIEIDSTKTDAAKLKALEDALYGTAEVEPRLPLPDEVITLMGGTLNAG